MRVLTVILWVCLASATAAMIGAAPATAQVRNLYEGDSIYNHITVREDGSERCMIFGRQQDLRQTCIDLRQPDRSVFEYTAMMFAAFLFNPEARRVCLIGLGGGYIPTVFKMHLPQVRLWTVEVDPLVDNLARKYFQFTVPGNHSLIIDDGRQFLKKNKERFDQIWLDAFNSDYIPAHMATREFLQLVKSNLSGEGIVIQNLFCGSRLYEAQIATIRTVFSKVFIFEGVRSGSCVVVGTDSPAADPAALGKAAARFKGRIGYIDLAVEVKKCVPAPILNKATILTDDFNPANLLLRQKP